MKWKDKLIKDIISSIKETSEEARHLKDLLLKDTANIHLAVFSEPYLSLIFSREKTMESRFSINRVIPYRKVFPHDIVLIKKTGGDILGFLIVKDVWYFSNLNEDKIKKINQQYGERLFWSADPFFLSNKKDAKFLSLILFDKIVRINPITSDKSDRMGWSIIKLGFNNTLFENKEL
jgi:hypothetical protein